MPLALTFTGNIDPTALATFILAVVTVISVVIGGKALRQARGEIEQTQNEIAVSRLAVEEAHRPVVIPVVDETHVMEHPLTLGSQTRPSFANHNIVIPIKNIGAGPALDIEVSVTPRNDAGEFSDAWGDRRYNATFVGIGIGEVTPVVIHLSQLGDLPSFDLWVTYRDVAGKRWLTAAKYLARTEHGKYTELSITTG
jgi:hypothetical protein